MLRHAPTVLVATFAVACLINGRAWAQDIQEANDPELAVWVVFPAQPLKGITKVFVTGPTLDADAKACQLSGDRAKRVASRSILDGGLVVTENASEGPELLMRVVTIAVPENLCAAYLSIQLMDFSAVLPSYQQVVPLEQLMDGKSRAIVRTAPAVIRLAESGFLLTGLPSTFGDRLDDQVKRITDDIVTKIKLANQPKE